MSILADVLPLPTVPARRRAAEDTVSALFAAIEAIPGVRVLARDHCHGRDWVINPATREVHVDGTLAPCAFVSAALEGLATLQRHLGNEAALLRTPVPRDELAARRIAGGAR